MIINGIDFDKRLNDAKQQLHWRIDYYIWPQSKEIIDFYKQTGFMIKTMESLYGLPKQLT